MKYSQFFVNSKKGNEVGLKWKILSFREKTKIFTDETWWENMGDGEVDMYGAELTVGLMVIQKRRKTI